MSIQKICSPKLVVPSVVVALLVGIAAVGNAQDETASAQKSDSAHPIVLVVPNFKDASDAEILNLSNIVEEQQNFIRRTLLEQLKDKNLSPFGRTEAISLLGSFSPNDYEIILALIQNMDFVSVRPPDGANTGFGGSKFASIFVGFIARRVLARIGITAEREILTIINTQRPTKKELIENPYLISYSFDPSKTEGFADVLTQIEGKQFAILKLQDGQTKAKNPAIKAQFQAVIEVVKKGAAPAPRNKY